MQIKKTITKDFTCHEKLKSKNLKSTLLYDIIVELAEKKDKQKRFKCWQEHIKKPKKPRPLAIIALTPLKG